MLKKLIYFIFATLLGCISAHAVDGSNIRIMVLQDDMDADINCVRSDNAVGKMVSSKISEQFNRYGYTVVPREAIAAELRFDINSSLSVFKWFETDGLIS